MLLYVACIKAFYPLPAGWLGSFTLGKQTKLVIPYKQYICSMPLIRILSPHAHSPIHTVYAYDDECVHTNGLCVNSSGNVEMGRRLLDGGALTHVAVDMRAYSGSQTPFSIASMTPLHFASLQGHLPFVKLLLQHNADVNMVTPIPVRPCWIHDG